MPTLLIADDEKNIREGLARALKPHGYKVLLAEDGQDAWRTFLTHKIDLAVVDIRMPEIDGLQLLEKIRQTEDPCPVLLLTGHGTVETAVEAMRLGAWDFLTKPVHLDKLELLIERALRTKGLETTTKALAVQVKTFEIEKTILGRSRALRGILDTVAKVGPTKATVHLFGESGTGKELLADALHQLGGADRPLIKVNCAALTPSLLESELFGHEKGAFTGADAVKIGRFEAADGGTLFLDEISEVPKEIQVKLLRVLQERVVERVGSHHPIPVNFRLVTAANRPLAEEVKAGRFREDLYYRVAVVEIAIPPLRERKGDVPLLARSFLEESARRNEVEEPDISAAAWAALENYKWPGNVRELRNTMERLVVLNAGKRIGAEDLPASLRPSAPGPDDAIRIPLGTSMDDAERIIIEETIRHCRGNKTEAARVLGIGRKTIHRKLGESEVDEGDDPTA